MSIINDVYCNLKVTLMLYIDFMNSNIVYVTDRFVHHFKYVSDEYIEKVISMIGDYLPSRIIMDEFTIWTKDLFYIGGLKTSAFIGWGNHPSTSSIPYMLMLKHLRRAKQMQTMRHVYKWALKLKGDDCGLALMLEQFVRVVSVKKWKIPTLVLSVIFSYIVDGWFEDKSQLSTLGHYDLD